MAEKRVWIWFGGHDVASVLASTPTMSARGARVGEYGIEQDFRNEHVEIVSPERRISSYGGYTVLSGGVVTWNVGDIVYVRRRERRYYRLSTVAGPVRVWRAGIVLGQPPVERGPTAAERKAGKR